MEINKNIGEKVERALHSMDVHQRATPAPYLATRINAALSAGKQPGLWDKFYAIITRPAVAMACIAIVLLLNIMIITFNDNTEAVRFQTDSRSDWQSYSISATSASYDVENIEP